MDERSRYLDDPVHRREFVRAACLLAALAQASDPESLHAAWLLRSVELLASPLPMQIH